MNLTAKKLRRELLEDSALGLYNLGVAIWCAVSNQGTLWTTLFAVLTALFLLLFVHASLDYRAVRRGRAAQ